MAKIDQIAAVVEDALNRHGVDLANVDGTLDDAADILNAMTNPEMAVAWFIESILMKHGVDLATINGTLDDAQSILIIAE